jgi:hypothetical protein
MAVPNNICIPLPRISANLPSVKLPMGAQFSGIVDFANGLPDDCSVAFNLMGQFNVALGQIQCPIAMLEVFNVLKDIAGPPPRPDKLGDLAEPLGKLAECFLSITPAQVALSIRDIIEAIVKILGCLIELVDSVLRFQARLDVSAAATNSKLADILFCAQQNAGNSTASVMKVLDVFGIILNTVAGLPGASELGIPKIPTSLQLSASTPSLESLVDTSEIQAVLDVLRQVVDALQQVLDKIP